VHESIQKAVEAARLADAKKADDIVVIDMREVCSFTDSFVIATGASNLQLRAIRNSIEEGLGRMGFKAGALEGNHNSSWIVMDYGDVVVHLMSPESREFYRLESLWGDGPEVLWEPDEAREALSGA
jgi:ribosome-associated protein